VNEFIGSVRRRASALDRTIVFAESDDPRILEAAQGLMSLGIARPVLLLDPDQPGTHAAAVATGAATMAGNGTSLLHMANRLVGDRTFDGCVNGVRFTTAEVLRAALGNIGLAPGVRTISSAFYMVGRNDWEAESSVLTFTDCAVVPYPRAEQLADIAAAAAADRRRIVGDEPRVAFLSFSTAGSGAGASVDTVREAVRILRSRDPSMIVDGELQADAALVPAIASRKCPGGKVMGTANVLVFPSLDAGNIAYKLVQRLAGADAIGPVLQGLARPAADLSRGAQVEDIINVAAIAALQSVNAPADEHTRREE